MGVEGIATPRPLTAGDALSSKRRSVSEDAPLALDELSRRRTSMPSSFAYGDDAKSPAESERRWRSFDCNAAPPSAAKAASLDVLRSRIQQERARAAEHSARLRPRKRSALLRSFLSSARKEQIELRRMEMVAQVAKCNRSLVVLRGAHTLVEMLDDEDDATPRHGGDASIQRMLDGIADADAVLAEDSLHHILELQAQFLQRSVELHDDKKLSSAKHAALAPFLAEFAAAGAPCVLDAPTNALVRFEKLANKLKLVKPATKCSFDALCRDTMSSFTRTDAAADAASVWDAREPRDVMQSLVRELEESMLETAPVAGDAPRAALHAFVEQVVFSRLAGACYRAQSESLDERNATWREQIVKARELRLEEIGLPVDVPEELAQAQAQLFAESIAAFNRIPHLVPSSVLATFLGAVRVLYAEADKLLGLACGCISADVLLPLLVFVLSRTDLPHLHSQVFLMEQFAIDASQEGSEAAYYLACLQAAMGYIMTEVGKKDE